MKLPQKRRMHFASIFFILCAVFCMALMNMVASIVIHKVSAMVMVCLQSLIALFVVSPLLIAKRDALFATHRIRLHIARGALAAFELYLFYLSMLFIPIVNVVVIENLTPIFIPLVSIFWLREKIAPVIWCSLGIGLVALVIVLHPSLAGFAHFAIVLPILAALVTAVVNVAIKKLHESESHEQILFFFLLFVFLFSLPFCLNCYNDLDYESIFLIGVMGVAFGMAQLFFQLAYKYSMPGRLSPFLYFEIIFTVLLANGILGMGVSLYMSLGILMVLISGVLSLNDS